MGVARARHGGAHRGAGQLPGRLAEHFDKENKDRSIFRKNIGRALLNRENDPFLEFWNLDLLSREMRERYQTETVRQLTVQTEMRVTDTIRSNFALVVIAVTGSASAEEQLAAEAAGVDYLLHKPLDIDRFRRILQPLH